MKNLIVDKLIQLREEINHQKQCFKCLKERDEMAKLIEKACADIAYAEQGFKENQYESLTDYYIHRKIAAEVGYSHLLNMYKKKQKEWDLIIEHTHLQPNYAKIMQIT